MFYEHTPRSVSSRRAYQLYQQQQQRPSTRLAKQNAFIVPKFGWPSYFKHGTNCSSRMAIVEGLFAGLAMKPTTALSETHLNSGNYFQFEYDKDYQRLQIQFLDFVDLHDLQGIMVR